jgi:hypothetical protein
VPRPCIHLLDTPVPSPYVNFAPDYPLGVCTDVIPVIYGTTSMTPSMPFSR